MSCVRIDNIKNNGNITLLTVIGSSLCDFMPVKYITCSVTCSCAQSNSYI